FETRHLENHRHRLQHKNAAHDEQHNFVPHHHRYHTQRRPQGQRAHIPHKHLGGIGVEPQKTETGATQGGAEHHQLADTGDKGNMQVTGELDVAHQVGKHAKGATHQYGGHDGQPVETIGEVDGIAAADNDEVGEDDVK